MTDQAEIWASALWSYFLPQMENGAPFYLAVDRNLIAWIAKEFLKIEVTAEKAAKQFHEACFELIERHDARATVKTLAFKAIDGKPFSRTICLAVQQVLVVEMMLADTEHSENSYFPRYRTLLGMVGGHGQINPLVGNTFARIWRTLEQEILDVQGTTRDSITFGPGKGRDTNRNYPFSQALLTTHELTIVKKRAQNLNSNSDPISIHKALYRVRLALGGRAQKLITTSNDELRERLCKQVQSFLTSEEHISTIRTRNPDSQPAVRLVAYLDVEYLFDDLFVVLLQRGNEQLTGTNVIDEIGRRISANRFITLVCENNGFEDLSHSGRIETGDSVLFIVNSESESALLETFAQENTPIDHRKSTLPDRFSLLFSSSVSSKTVERLIPRNAGPLLGITLAGGLMADVRSRTYLAEYPPKEILWQGVKIKDETEIIVSGRPTQARVFLDSLASDNNFSVFSIQICDDKLDFAVSRGSFENHSALEIGHPIRGDELSALAVSIDNDEVALRGVSLPDSPKQSGTSSPPLLTASDLFHLAARGKREPIDRECVALLLDALKHCVGSRLLIRLLSHQISSTQSVPLQAKTHGVLEKFRRTAGGLS